MPLSIPSIDDLVDRGLGAFRIRFPGKDTHTESFLGKTARALSMTLLAFLQALQSLDDDSVPSTRTSASGLDRWGFAIGVPADTQGNYGRKGPTIASGGQGLCTGTVGTVFPDGSVLTAPDGVTEIALAGTVQIAGSPPGTGSVLGKFVAITSGSAGNLEAGTDLTWQSTPSGADSDVTLTAPLSGALDSEADTNLLGRELDRLQKPPKGGTSPDYRRWAEAVAGVYRAYSYPLRGGMATAHVVLTSAGSGTARLPSTAVKTAVDAYINGTPVQESQRPTTVEGYQSILPFFGNGMSIRLRMIASLAKYGFDWSLGATGVPAASYASGPPSVLTLAGLAPASLTSAVDQGAKPRIQVAAPSLVIPAQARCLAYDNSGGVQTKLTLDSALPAAITNPLSGVLVFPGGPMVSPIARGVLSYVDSLGPSRASGYADPFDLWEDTCSIFRLGDVALEARDTDATRMAKDALAITIDGLATNRAASDFTANGPELLWCLSILVTD